MIELLSQPVSTSPQEAGPERLLNAGRNGKVTLRLAADGDRETIYRLRHEVYAGELRQHPTNAAGRLTDSLDPFNTYIVACEGSRIIGFISITPPGAPSYSIDKYLKRETLPFAFDEQLYELRLLTIPTAYRQGLLALALMYAAFRWAEARGGQRIVAIGRREILRLYFRVGMKPVGITVQSGAVTYEVLQGIMPGIHAALVKIRKMLDRIETEMAWEIGVTYRSPAECYHGGEFFTAVGEEFESLERLESVISADVLDAWFPPSPGAVEAVQRHLPRLLQTSPPTGCAGLVRTIARARGVKPECILAGAGSSDLIFLALRHWLTPRSRVLILDPTYGEYLHVLERVIQCRVDRLLLPRSDNYRLDPRRLECLLDNGYDLVVLVNPNNPAGQLVLRDELDSVLRKAAPATRVWVDETYIDYAGAGESLEVFAARSANVIVCKSMSKAFALSGARVAYLCASPHQLESLRPISPPWAVSLPAQVAAVRALQEPAYYAARYRETHQLRRQLGQWLKALDWEIVPSVTNFLLCHLPADGPDAATVIARCRERGLFLRDASTMGSQLGDRTIRVAVKDAATNQQMVRILGEVLGALSACHHAPAAGTALVGKSRPKSRSEDAALRKKAAGRNGPVGRKVTGRPPTRSGGS
jgi:histidinol-phosphate/aromatic aminotransferase/cobyric acid decarboxylase-like protein/N-acyl-L-homoserine lactone synthetase